MKYIYGKIGLGGTSADYPGVYIIPERMHVHTPTDTRFQRSV